MTITWPDILVPWSASIEIRSLARGGGQTLNGREQRVFQGPGLWEVSYTIPIRTTAQIKAWRAMRARLRGGEDIVVKVFDRQRLALTGGLLATVTTASAATGATQLAMEGAEADLNEGDHFSIGNRLYIVTERVAALLENAGLVLAISENENWDDSDEWIDGEFTQSTVKFLPPLRAAVVAGASVTFENLRVRCVLKDVSDGDLPLDQLRFATPSITFIESI